MAQFTVNAQRFDPYKNFKFRVKWDGRYVAGVSKVSALKPIVTGFDVATSALSDPGILLGALPPIGSYMLTPLGLMFPPAATPNPP